MRFYIHVRSRRKDWIPRSLRFRIQKREGEEEKMKRVGAYVVMYACMYVCG